MSEPAPRSGGQLVVDSLVANGVERAFGVAGESYLEVLDALVDAPSIHFVTTRFEGAAANMAEADGKLTGRPGVCMVTRGPGACHASIGVHTAFQDSTPMILLVGQVARHMTGREAFQEVDYRRFFAPLAKWVEQIDQAERVPEIMQRAFHIAMSGRPGPVVVALPEDMLRDRVAVAPPVAAEGVRPAADPAAFARLSELLAKAERPAMLVGGSGWSDAAAADIAAFAEANRIPTACSFRRQDVVPTDSPVFIGDLGTGPAPTTVARLKESDLLLVVGARLGEITTQGYGLFPAPDTGKTLVHVHVDANELGRTYRPSVAINAGMPEAAAALRALPPIEPGWREWTTAARGEFGAWHGEPPAAIGDLDLGQCMLTLRRELPDNAVVTVDAGNCSGWPQRFLSYRRPGRLLGPTSGAMGYSVPAGVAAKLRHPDRLVVSCVGDGSFGMTGQELATAVQERAPVIFLVFNNNMYGTIRMHQEKRFPDRISGTYLTNPDYAALAAAHGAFGATVTRTEDFRETFEAAVASGNPAVIELRYDPEMVSTRTTLSALREAGRKAARAGH